MSFVNKKLFIFCAFYVKIRNVIDCGCNTAALIKDILNKWK